jgi:hypothetical protein
VFVQGKCFQASLILASKAKSDIWVGSTDFYDIDEHRHVTSPKVSNTLQLQWGNICMAWPSQGLVR